MLSPIIKKLLETQLGKEIRYSSDIEHLSYEIEKHTGQSISTNTLKRLFGIIEGIKEPRLYTLDIISRYLGFKNWDGLTEELENQGNSSFTSIEELDVQSLQSGDTIVFCYSPDRMVHVKFIESNRFIVEKSMNSKLQQDDILSIDHFVLKCPLIINQVTRHGADIGKFTAGKVSGITSLQVNQK